MDEIINKLHDPEEFLELSEELDLVSKGLKSTVGQRDWDYLLGLAWEIVDKSFAMGLIDEEEVEELKDYLEG